MKDKLPTIENERLPIFEGELELPNDLKIILKHKNYNEIISIEIQLPEGKKVDLKNYLPLPEDIAFGIGNDFYVEKRRHLPDRISIPDLKSYKEFEDITSRYEYLLLLFHEFGHVNSKGLQAEIKLFEFYKQFPEAKNAFQLSAEKQSEAIGLESDAEIEAWKWAINQIKKIEQDNGITILPQERVELENSVNMLLVEYKQKYNDLLAVVDKEYFKIKLDS